MVDIIILTVSTFTASGVSYVVGRKSKKIEYKYPECAHVWGKWTVATIVNSKSVWGQQRQCEICDFTQWLKGTG